MMSKYQIDEKFGIDILVYNSNDDVAVAHKSFKSALSYVRR